MKKKKLAVIAVIVCLVSIISVGSLAWFSDSKTITNKFKFASSGDPSNPDADFAITLYEYQDDKVTITTEGRTYADVAPGAVLYKCPSIKNTGKYDEYVKVSITVSDYEVWKELYDATTAEDVSAALRDADTGMFRDINAKLAYDSCEAADGKLTMVFYYDGILKPFVNDQQTPAVVIFSDACIPAALTQTDVEKFAQIDDTLGFSIEVAADAVQSDNILADSEIGTATNLATAAFAKTAFAKISN